MPIREPPPLEALEYADVLSNYGQTMLYVQYFERTLKAILKFHRILKIASVGSLNFKELEQLMGRRDPALESVLRRIFSEWKKLGLSPLPKQGEESLLSLIKVRKRLAHSYLSDNAILLKNVEGCKIMIAELRWYSELFLSMKASMEPFITHFEDHFVKHLIDDPCDLKQIEAEYGPLLEQIHLEKLRANLTRMGISLAEPPENPA